MYYVYHLFKKIYEKIFKDSLLKNSTYLIATGVSNSIIGFFFWVIAARYYTPSDIGIISAILSSIFLISTISLLGLPNLLTFYLPMYPKSTGKIIDTCLIISIVVSIIFSLIYIFGINIWAPELKLALEDFKLKIIFIITIITTTISLLMTGIFTAGRRTSFHMIKENIFAISRISLLILFVNFGAVGIFLSWSIGSIIAVALGFFLSYKLMKYIPTLRFDPMIKNMASFSIENYIAGIFYNLPKFIFPIMIVNSISAEFAGYFFIAMTMAGLLYAVPISLVFPFLAESSDKDRFWNNVNKAIKFNIGLLIPGLLLFIIFGRFVLNIFNPNYAENSFITLIILSITSIPLSLIIIFNTVRTAQKRIKIVIMANAIVAIMTFILSVPLIKIWNIDGAAMAYLIANTVVATIIIFRMKDPIEFTMRLVKEDKNIIKAVRVLSH